MTIKAKILLWFLPPAILITTVTSAFCYFYTYKTIKKNIFDQLEIAADEIREQVRVFLKGKRGRIVDISSDGYIRDTVEEIVMKENRRKYYTTILKDYLVMNKKSIDHSILEIFIVDLNGRIIVSTDEGRIDDYVPIEKYSSEIGHSDIFVSDPHYDTRLKSIIIDFSTSILSKTKQEPVGIIVNSINVAQEDSIIKNGKSAQQDFVLPYSQLITANKTRVMDFSFDDFIRESTEEITRRDDRVLHYMECLNDYLAVNKQPLDPDLLAIFVVNLDGKIISSTRITQIGRNVSDETFFLETMRRGSCISDVRYSPEFKQDTFFDVAKLLLTRDGLHTIGIIVNRYIGNSFNKITSSKVIGEFGEVKQFEGLGETGELYIVNRDKLMVTESRFNKDVILKQVVDTESVRTAFDNEMGMIGIYSNYRGIPIFGVSRYIEEMDWVVLAEKSISEAFAPLANLRNFTIIMGIVGITIMVSVAIYFAKRITMPITSLASAASYIASGNLKGIEGIKSRDEIGNLADSFNKMTINLTKFRDDLKQSEERYRDLIENSSEIIYQADKERFFMSANKTMLDKLGYQSEVLLGMKMDNIVPTGEREKVINHIKKVIENGNDSIETMFLSKEGEIIYVEINANALYDSDGNFIQYTAFARDTTERKKAEAAEKHGKDLQLLSSQIISVQEEERRRISRELHDEAGQALTAMKINVEMIEKEIPESSINTRKRLAETKQLLTNTLSEVRSLSFELRPSLLDHFGIVAAIKGYSKNYSERTNIDVQVRGKSIVERFSSEIETLLYRCTQEALTNVAKHSEAKHVIINILCDENELCLKIKDDGKGFDVNKNLEKHINGGLGMGLFGMKERVALLNGRLKIHSERNKGTELEIFVPFKVNVNTEITSSEVNENV